VIITPNITFDDETGIGSWTRDDFWRALHEGVRRDGAQLYPAMPYPYFTRMPREDVDAIYDFLQTIQPVRVERVPEEELPAPLQVRAAVRVWKAAELRPGRVRARSRPLDGVEPRRLPGGRAGALRRLPHRQEPARRRRSRTSTCAAACSSTGIAPNIRGGENGGIAHWSEDEIVAFLRTGRTAHTIAMERMGEVVALSTQHMTEEDLRRSRSI
jgi:hypothetical protein